MKSKYTNYDLGKTKEKIQKFIFENTKKERKLSKDIKNKFQRLIYSYLFKRLKQLTETIVVHFLLFYRLTLHKNIVSVCLSKN